MGYLTGGCARAASTRQVAVKGHRVPFNKPKSGLPLTFVTRRIVMASKDRRKEAALKRSHMRADGRNRANAP